MSYSESPGTGGYVVSEASGHRSRKSGKIAIDPNEYLVGTVVSLLGSEYVRYDGVNSAAGILFQSGDASTDVLHRTFHVSDCEVNRAELVWSADGEIPLTASQIAAGETELATLGIIVR